MKVVRLVLLAALALAPMASHAAAVRTLSPDEVAVRKVSARLIEDDLKFETQPVDNVCGTTGQPGTDVKVGIAASGRVIVIRHYGVTNAGFFRSEKVVVCPDSGT